MKTSKVLLLCVALLAGCSDSTTTPSVATKAETEKSEAQPVAFNTAGAPTVMFEVSDMVCESCTEAVHDTLAKQPGAKEVIVDLEKKVATVAVDDAKFDKEAAVAALLDKQFSHAKLLAAPEKPTEPTAPEAPAEPEHKEG